MADIEIGYTWSAGSVFTASKMNDSVNLATIAAGALADSTAGRAKMADGFLSADAEGRAKMADGYVTQAEVSAGFPIQVVQQAVTGVDSTVLAITIADSIPTISMGREIFSQAITTSGASNKVLVEVVLNLASATALSSVSAALFRNGGTNAIAAASTSINTADQLTFKYLDSPGSAAEHTYAVRYGNSDAASQLGVNGRSGTPGGRLFGGASMSTLTLTEIKG